MPCQSNCLPCNHPRIQLFQSQGLVTSICTLIAAAGEENAEGLSLTTKFFHSHPPARSRHIASPTSREKRTVHSKHHSLYRTYFRLLVGFCLIPGCDFYDCFTEIISILKFLQSVEKYLFNSTTSNQDTLRCLK